MCQVPSQTVCRRLPLIQRNKITTRPSNSPRRPQITRTLGRQMGHIVVIPILCIVVRPSLHEHYLSVRLQLLLSLSGFVGMMIATDVYFLQFHNCVVYLRVMCQIPSQTLCRRLPLIVDWNHIEDSLVCATTVEGFSSA
jgi:hypothetical protein